MVFHIIIHTNIDTRGWPIYRPNRGSNFRVTSLGKHSFIHSSINYWSLYLRTRSMQRDSPNWSYAQESILTMQQNKNLENILEVQSSFFLNCFPDQDYYWKCQILSSLFSSNSGFLSSKSSRIPQNTAMPCNIQVVSPFEKKIGCIVLHGLSCLFSYLPLLSYNCPATYTLLDI
jgi:hypothetical protein